MKPSTKNSAKKSRGRPKVDSEAVNVRLQRPILDALDKFRAEEADNPSRPEAARRLLADSLTGLGLLKADDD
jgi:hypothetical protein